MELGCLKFDPAGNTTALILDPVSRLRQPELAAAIMGRSVLAVEQVGFVEAPNHPEAAARLQMMAGEFCGNATRCLAMAVALKLLDGEAPTPLSVPEIVVRLETSGYPELLTATVSPTGRADTCLVRIDMPLPKTILHGQKADTGKYSLVAFDGICHLVLWEKVPNPALIEPSRALVAAAGFAADNFGVMFYQCERQFMTPLVVIGAVGSETWEHSCGSGTMAVLSALADCSGQSVADEPINQPGGRLTGSVRWDNGVRELELAGEIRLTLRGEVLAGEFADRR